MSPTDLRAVLGTILAVQEYRFTILTDDGRGLLLTLSRYAPTGLEGLCDLLAEHAHVYVEYSGEPNLDGLAHVVMKI